MEEGYMLTTLIRQRSAGPVAVPVVLASDIREWFAAILSSCILPEHSRT